MNVGVSELRANLKEYLDRVKAGEDIIITEHGIAVARLCPVDWVSHFDRLVADGVIAPAAEEKQPIPDWEPIPSDGSVLEILLEQRGQRP